MVSPIQLVIGNELSMKGSRLNTKLESQSLEPMTDLVRDFSSGVKLIEVLCPCSLMFAVRLYTS